MNVKQNHVPCFVTLNINCISLSTTLIRDVLIDHTFKGYLFK